MPELTGKQPHRAYSPCGSKWWYPRAALIFVIIVAGWIHDGHMEPTAELLTFPESSDALSLCPWDQGPRARGPGLSAQGCTWPPRDLKYPRVRSGFPPCRLAKLTSIYQYKTLEPPAF